MTRNALAAIALAVALGAGTALAASTPAKAPTAAAPTTLISIIAKHKGQEIRIVKGGDKPEMRDLLDVGTDFVKLAGAESDETYIPLARIRAVSIKNDKLFIHVD